MSEDTYIVSEDAKRNYAQLRELGIFASPIWVNRAMISFCGISITVDLNRADFMTALLSQVWDSGRAAGQADIKDGVKTLLGL